MVSGTLTLFTDADLDRLYQGVLRILSHTGVRVYHDEFLKALAGTSAEVNQPAHLVKFPEPMVEAFISEKKQKPWLPEREKPLLDQKEQIGLSGVIAPFYYDYDQKKRRSPLKEDLLNIIRWADVDLDPTQEVGLAVTLSDEDPRVEPIAAYALLLEHSQRPSSAYVLSADQIPFLVELSTVYYGHPVLPRGTDFMTSPLTFDQRLADYTLAAIHFGKDHFFVGTMPISGSNAPVTLAGTVILGVAELVGAALTIRSLAPQATFEFGTCTGYTDLRKGFTNFNSPQALLTDLGIVELVNRRFGGPGHVAAGSDYIDASLPGMQVAYERVYRAMAIAAFTGSHFRLGGQGTLEAGQIFSPVQFILERELSEGLWRLGQGIVVDEENMALDLIDAIGPGERGSYLETEHTLHHYRQGWFPKMLYRGPYEGDTIEHGRDVQMLDAAAQRFKQAIARYVPPELDPVKVKELHRIVEKAKKALVNGH
jgi:trimethylamine--corrinoid protein Co-methyltransferase